MSQVLARSQGGTGSRFTWQHKALLGLLGVQLLLALTLPVAAPFSVDEVVYGEMTRSLTEGFGFFIDNGYEEVASPELATRFMRPTVDDRLAGQYPYGLPILAAPAYSILGTRGIMVVNALAFVAVVAFTHAIATRLLSSRWIANASAAILVLSTFAWEYSLAIWPHMSMLALVLGSILAILKAADTDTTARQSTAWAASSGLLFGLAVLNRYDAVLMLPILALLLYRTSTWARTASWFALGAVPAVAVLSFSNWQRWGTPLPLSYGGSVTGWLIPIVIAASGLAVLTAGVVYGVRRMPLASTQSVLGLITVATLAVLAVPITRAVVFDTVAGVWTLVADLRSYRITDESALSRLPDGSLVYFGVVKKSLLQSAPYLALIGLPLITSWRGEHRRAGLLLAAPVATYIVFFAPRAWHGGMSFNLRYFLPLLPFAAILTAWGIRELVGRAGVDGRTARMLRLVVLGTLALFAGGRVAFSSLTETAWLMSVPALALAALTVVAVAWLLTRPSQSAARLTLAVTLVGLTWAGAVAFGYDAAATLQLRQTRAEKSEAIADFVDPGSLLLVEWPDDTFGVKDHLANIVIALPENDDFETFGSVVGELAIGRSVFGAMTPESWNELPDVDGWSWADLGLVDNYVIRELSASATAKASPHSIPAVKVG